MSINKKAFRLFFGDSPGIRAGGGKSHTHCNRTAVVGRLYTKILITTTLSPPTRSGILPRRGPGPSRVREGLRLPRCHTDTAIPGEKKASRKACFLVIHPDSRRRDNLKPSKIKAAFPRRLVALRKQRGEDRDRHGFGKACAFRGVTQTPQSRVRKKQAGRLAFW